MPLLPRQFPAKPADRTEPNRAEPSLPDSPPLKAKTLWAESGAVVMAVRRPG